MATFNVSFLNPKLRQTSGGGVNIMSDQLSMLENELAKDGYLSPGDYDILISKGQEIKNSGGLTADQSSNFAVKISNYQKARELSVLNKGEDIPRINRVIKSESAEDVMMVGNNPEEFLKGRAASIQAKLNELAEVIQRRETVGSDTTEYWNEYQSTLKEYSEKLEALELMSGFDGANPVKGHVAYVTTNNKGEIVDVDYARLGSKSGYAETNGMIDGFQVFGKINFKENGRNNFVLGDQTFSAVDMMIPDPTNPGSFKSNKLESNVQQRGPIAIGEGGFLNMPGSNLNIQSYVPNNSWARGTNGTLYFRRQDGGYTKYINTKEEDLNIEGGLLNLTSPLEASLMNGVDETVDGADLMEPDEGLPMTPLSQLPMELGATPSPTRGLPATPPAPSIPSTPQPQDAISGQPKQPTERASEGFLPTARRTIQSGTEFLKGLFR